MRIRVYTLILLSIILSWSQICFTQWDGGRLTGRIDSFDSESDKAFTAGTSFGFKSFFQNNLLLSIFGEIGITIFEDSSEKKEYLGLVGLELNYTKLFLELRISINVPDILENDKQDGWTFEPGILIPISNKFLLTLNFGTGNILSTDRNCKSFYSISIIFKIFNY